MVPFQPESGCYANMVRAHFRLFKILPGNGMAAVEAQSVVEEAMELSSQAVEGEQRVNIKIPVVFEKDEEADKERDPPVDVGFACIISEIPRPALEEALEVGTGGLSP